MTQEVSCGSQLTVCIRKQLVALYIIWLAVAGVSVTFVIIPGSQTLLEFQGTQCNTVQASKSGENACTYCLQIHVVTNDLPSSPRQLHQHEQADDERCTFRSWCELENENALALLNAWTEAYGINGSTFPCFSHKSKDSSRTVLAIKRYPQSVIMQFVLWLSLSLLILILCMMHTCRRTWKQVGKETTFRRGSTYSKSARVLSFRWRSIDKNAGNDIKNNLYSR